jgi:hypothetical protein
MTTEFILKFILAGKYDSPDHENSIYKGIPIEFRDHPVVEKFLKGGKYRIKYRGTSKPGYRRPQSFIRKEYADTFAIYPRGWWKS